MTTTTGPRGSHRAPSADAAASVVAALHSRAEDIRRAELDRAEDRWESLCADDRRRLEAMTRRIVDALLDGPTERLRAEADAGGACLASACYLFALDPRGPDAAPSRPAPHLRRSLWPRWRCAGGSELGRGQSFPVLLAPA